MTAPRTALKMGAALAAVLALAACGGGRIGETPGGSQSAPDNKKLALLPGVKGEPFYISMECGAKEEATKLGYELSVQAPEKFDASLQVPIVNSVQSTRPAGVLIAPTDDTALGTPMKQLTSAGIKVVEVDTKLKDRSIAASAISSNNKQGGQLAAQTLAKLIGEKGSVLVINTKAGTSTTDARAAGFEEEIKKYPNIKYVGQKYSDNEPSQAANIVSAQLAATPDLAGVFATNLNSGEGAAAGLRNANKRGEVKLVGFDASPKQVDGLRAGDVQALIAQDPAGIGRQGVQQAVNAIEGKSVTKEIETNLVALTSEDMQSKQQYFYRTSC
ncbi:ribose transport system substrate-binding protein [Crossiella equi]|uniref:Ribose transport system substrate-binding protein n=1 Tax=Crossiella equi TaxID=130796 RepID=A0ABS5AJT4_9PSEU|nr:ABC transporter substrate-binding protein [Crossiella equi]MBP2476839.1 ribose transport system substrate-binding protein [Crossiella equi]